MQGILYEEPTMWLFLLITVVLGGGAAWATGRACALTWRPYTVLVVYLLILGFAVRFVHHAVFGGTLLSAHYYAVDALVCLVIGTLGYRFTRTRQMITQYYWLYEPAGPLSWRARTGGAVQ